MSHDLLTTIWRGNEAQWPRMLIRGRVVVVVAVQRPNGLGDVMARVGYGQLVAMAAAGCKAATDIAGSRRGLKLQ